MEKEAYISAPIGELEITITHTARPEVIITLDLGIPKFTVFSIKFPCIEDKPQGMQELVAEAIHTLLDEVATFLISMKYEQDVIVQLYATVLSCFKGMTNDSDPQRAFPEVSRDPALKAFKGTFRMPQSFVDETHHKVVVAGSGKLLKRIPPARRIELTPAKPNKNDLADAARVIRQYRNRSLKQQPKPMYVIVYDQAGRPTGTLPLTNRFKTNLYSLVKGAAAVPEMTEPAQFANDIDMKTKNVQGIPKNVTVGSSMFFPEAFCGDDMALYKCQTWSGYQGGREYLVKFPDGRLVRFSDRPSIQKLRKNNYPVPQRYFRWNVIREDAHPESIETSEATHEIGTGSSPEQQG